MFIWKNVDLDINLETDVDICCHCGKRGQTTLVHTPLKSVRFFIMMKTDITLYSEFPYCNDCEHTSTRIRENKWYMFAMVFVVSLMLWMVFGLLIESSNGFGDSLFLYGALFSFCFTFIYWYISEFTKTGRNYYQPVKLSKLKLKGDDIHKVELKFYNHLYSTYFEKQNRRLISSGFLKVK